MSADAKFKLRFLVLYYMYMGPISTIHEWDILVMWDLNKYVKIYVYDC